MKLDENLNQINNLNFKLNEKINENIKLNELINQKKREIKNGSAPTIGRRVRKRSGTIGRSRILYGQFRKHVGSVADPKSGASIICSIGSYFRNISGPIGIIRK